MMRRALSRGLAPTARHLSSGAGAPVQLSNDEMRRALEDQVRLRLAQAQVGAAETLVPYVVNQLPAAYQRIVPESVRLSHLQAIASMWDGEKGQPRSGLNAPMELMLRDHDAETSSQTVTFVVGGGKSKATLSKQLSSLPSDLRSADLQQVNIFEATDGDLMLSMFKYASSSGAVVATHEEAQTLYTYAAELQAGMYEGQAGHPEPSHLFEEDSLREYVARCPADYVRDVSPAHQLRARLLYEACAAGGESVHTLVEPRMRGDGGEYWMTIASANVSSGTTLKRSCEVVHSYGLDIARSHCERIASPDGNGDISLFRLLVSPSGAAKAAVAADEKAFFCNIKKDLGRIKWLDEMPFQLAMRPQAAGPKVNMQQAEVIAALVNCAHTPLAKQDAWMFSRQHMQETVVDDRYLGYAVEAADLLAAKTDPDAAQRLSPAQAAEKAAALRAAIAKNVELPVARTVLAKLVDIVDATLRTNLHLDDRLGLAFRLKTEVLHHEGDERDHPFGVFFVTGRRFSGFHTRFREIARGGLRLVAPRSGEQHAVESARQYDECYSLAFAQQLKNKDIPEGGSKAVVLVDHSDMADDMKDLMLRRAVKGFTDGLLDLIVPDPDNKVVDLLGYRELLYLGPDENVIPDDINWIVARAALRGLEAPSCFMSSKPDDGINHKEYGVTSEGVAVFLDVALNSIANIDTADENSRFTIKMTGGPDGDVGGNLLKILAREYGDRCSVVGIADGSGAAEDANGLDLEELLKLVEADAPIANYPKHALSAEGVLWDAETTEGARMRNNMHNRVVADAFVPCGGRPSTIDASNYRDFILEDGTPSSPLIVEGANLFVTPEAREKLGAEAGVVCVKDSSANKCGVICSSYEIQSSMLLSAEEYHANKEEVVNDVLVKLRHFAQNEADLLFRLYHAYDGDLPSFSVRISDAINRVTDAVSSSGMLDEDDNYEALLPLVKDHMPASLADLAWDRLDERVPRPYIKNMMASSAASHVVYSEGVHFIEGLNDKDLAKLAIDYMATQRHVDDMQATVAEADGLDDDVRQEVMSLLARGGVRTRLGF